VIDQPPANWKRGLLNCFIAIHLLILFLWGLPGNKLAAKAKDPVTPYVLFTGLWHIWNMFGPDLCTIQMDLRARIKFRDGSEKEWIAPRMQELSLWDRVPKERYRKWRERQFHQNSAPIWPASARFIARQVNINPTNPPVHVALTRHWTPTPQVIPNQDYQRRPKSYLYKQSLIYFHCPITAKDL
jgi:hypothetical protein